jgi:hypothetical protein
VEATEETWVNTVEGAEITGYNPDYLRELVRNNWKLPEDQRLIRVRKRSNRYDIWLPDLIYYLNNQGNGPHNRPKTDT